MFDALCNEMNVEADYERLGCFSHLIAPNMNKRRHRWLSPERTLDRK